jgi:hypothetical protein
VKKMRTSLTLVLVGTICTSLCMAPCGPPASAAGLVLQAQTTDSGAQSIVRLTAEGDELSILFPARPSVFRSKPLYSYADPGELITEERVSAAYANGVVYLLLIQRAGNPRRAMREYIESVRRDDKRRSGQVKWQEVNVRGQVVQQLEFRDKLDENGESYYRKAQYFTTRHYFCIVNATARDGATPEMDDFFSSLKFGDRTAAGTGVADNLSQNEQQPGAQATFRGVAFEAKDVTRQALPVWQPQLYSQLIGAATDLDQRRYEVRVQAILTADGEVADVKVLGPASHDVVAIATEMTRHTKFIPAELNGRPVSQRHTFKYKL